MLTKPVFSQASAPWETAITFPKTAKYTYALKETKTGVTLSEIKGNRMQVTATESAQNVIIVARLAGVSSESDPIEFTRKQGNTLSFTYPSMRAAQNTNIRQGASKSGEVAGDDREIRYDIKPGGNGVTIDANTRRIEVANDAAYGSYTVTASLEQNKKYTRSEAEYALDVVKL